MILAMIIIVLAVLFGTAWGFWCGWMAAKSRRPIKNKE